MFSRRGLEKQKPDHSITLIMAINSNKSKRQKTANSTEIYNKSDLSKASLQLFSINKKSTIKYPERAGGFDGINPPALQGGFFSTNFSGEDGRSHKSKQGVRVNPALAETIGSRIDSLNMKDTSNGSEPSNPIITQKGCPSCGSEYGVITEGTPPHHAALRCGCCNKFLKWMPKPKGGAIRQNDSFEKLNNMGGR